MSDLNHPGYAFGGKRAAMIERRLAYIARHGAGFLFNNQPPPAPGWPRPIGWREQ